MSDITQEDNEESSLCSICYMAAFHYCSQCDDAICEICGVEDEGIIFCYECWLAREAELLKDEDETS